MMMRIDRRQGSTTTEDSSTQAPDPTTRVSTSEPANTTSRPTSSPFQTRTTTTSEGTTTSATQPTPTTSDGTTASQEATTSSPTSSSGTTTTQPETSDSVTSSTSATPSETSQTTESATASTDGTTSQSNQASSRSTITPGSTTRSNEGPTSSTESESTSGVTSIIITTVTTISGTASTYTIAIPTLATGPGGSSGLSPRTSKIVGGVVGGTLAMIGILIVLFFISRRRRKIQAARDNPRLQAPRQLLDNEDFDLTEPGPAPYQYGVVGARANPNASGSIFHEALPGTNAHSYSRSLGSETDPLIAHHIRAGSADVDSITTSSPRESTHFRTSSTTGLLYDSNDPFASSSSRPHPAAVAKALEARSRGSLQHVYPPSAYHGPPQPSAMPSASGVVVHQDAGRVDVPDAIPPPEYRGNSNNR